MPHFLYRPHIDHGDKIVTTDFLIRRITVKGRSDVNLPVDLANCHIDLVMFERSFIAPLLFAFCGDSNVYLAPAIGLLDGDIFEHDRAAAWRNARISISRNAIKPSSNRVQCTFQIGDAPAALMESDRASELSVSRFEAFVLPAGQATEATPGNMALTIEAGPSVTHRLAVSATGQEATS